jgi:transcriptional regulator with XRE-family HTH domain
MKRMRNIEQTSSNSRRPIEPAEVPDLRRFGELLRQARERIGLTVAEAARRAMLSRPYVWRLEHGERRPRLSTIRLLARSLSTCADEPESRALELEKRLVTASGRALAPESPYELRSFRRRWRRAFRGRFVARSQVGRCPCCWRPLARLPIDEQQIHMAMLRFGVAPCPMCWRPSYEL